MDGVDPSECKIKTFTVQFPLSVITRLRTQGCHNISLELTKPRAQFATNRFSNWLTARGLLRRCCHSDQNKGNDQLRAAENITLRNVQCYVIAFVMSLVRPCVCSHNMSININCFSVNFLFSCQPCWRLMTEPPHHHKKYKVQGMIMVMVITRSRAI